MKNLNIKMKEFSNYLVNFSYNTSNFETKKRFQLYDYKIYFILFMFMIYWHETKNYGIMTLKNQQLVQLFEKFIIITQKMILRTSNDDRSDALNPNNDSYWHNQDNHANQLNPNNKEYKGK